MLTLGGSRPTVPTGYAGGSRPTVPTGYAATVPAFMLSCDSSQDLQQFLMQHVRKRFRENKQTLAMLRRVKSVTNGFVCGKKQCRVAEQPVKRQ